jgi:hypothetical protein
LSPEPSFLLLSALRGRGSHDLTRVHTCTLAPLLRELFECMAVARGLPSCPPLNLVERISPLDAELLLVVGKPSHQLLNVYRDRG